MKHFFLSIAIAGLTAPAACALTVTVSPGTLQDAIASIPAGEQELNVEGSLDARDLAALRKLPSSVRSLDLGAARLAAYNGKVEAFGGRSMFAEGEIPVRTFFASPLEEIILPANLKTVGEGAFSRSGLQSVALPAGVVALGDYAFYGCRQLKSASLPSSLKSVGRMAFADCGRLESVSFAGNALTALPDKAFSGCWELASLSLPAGVRRLGSEVFAGTTIAELDLSKVTSASEYALSGMSRLETVRLNPAARYDTGLLAGNGRLNSVSGVPADIPALFAALSQSLDISQAIEGARAIGAYAFAGNGAGEMVLGEGLTEISRGAFAGMESLHYIDARSLEGNIPTAAEDAWSGGDPASVTLHVTTESLPLWKEDSFWSRFNVTDDDSGVAEKAFSDAIRISLSGRKLRVTAPSAVVSCVVCDLQGNVLLNTLSRLPELEAELDRLPADGPVVVAVRCADGSARTVSLISARNG